jgi:imidazolonepropionase-like amidohydrolase
VGWLGPGRLIEDVVVVVDAAGLVVSAGPASGLAAWMAGGPVEPETELSFDGFVMPGVVDRHVHVGLSDPTRIVANGVTAVRDLGWPPRVIHRLAAASEDSSFGGPLIRAVGPMLTCRGGYPTRAGWAPRGTGLEVRGPDDAGRATREVLAASSAAVVKVALNAEAGPVLYAPAWTSSRTARGRSASPTI